MRTSTTLFFSGFAALSGFAAAAERTVPIYIQPVSISPPAPVLLGEVVYDAALLAGADPASAAKVTSFEYPSDLLSPDNEDDDETKQRAEVPRHVRVGAWDPATKSWASSTSLASTANFDKGFAPHFVVTVDDAAAGSGDVVGVVLKGVRIDAGQTRDFGPQVVLRTAEPGSQIELNKPVVLSPEGRKVAEEPEKTLLQKYWWIIGIVIMLTLTGGGGDGK
ncbi:cyclin-dependent protein kinase regulator pho80 [Apiospora sp. TS-2023a]